MKISKIFQRSDKQNVISALVALHRAHYHEPGYLLNDKVKNMYSEIYDILSIDSNENCEPKIKFKWDNKLHIYNVTIGKHLLRDWVTIEPNQFATLANHHMNRVDLTDNQIVAELLTEITFKSFPNNA